ncbi:TlyA family RNA methyltransferase [Candidatus Saccharibacteria bacterium]|nr:TlyA family RNA methyltransferase [Candidatus Saccharibacteria bacterium]
MKQRLDAVLAARGLVASRSQAESWIKLGKVTVDGKTVTKPGFFVSVEADIRLKAQEQFVSRAGLKLASVAKVLGLQFKDKVVLDIGSSTGGFTDFSLKRGARRVIAVDVGTDQLHPSLRGNSAVELYEKTDIRDFMLPEGERPDITVMDLSFISLREILPHVFTNLSTRNTHVVAMLKPQFEAGKHQVNKGVIKNDTVRRQILKDFELWVRQYAVVADKADSEVAGSKGNRERFYLLKPLR